MNTSSRTGWIWSRSKDLADSKLASFAVLDFIAGSSPHGHDPPLQHRLVFKCDAYKIVDNLHQETQWCKRTVLKIHRYWGKLGCARNDTVVFSNQWEAIWWLYICRHCKKQVQFKLPYDYPACGRVVMCAIITYWRAWSWSNVVTSYIELWDHGPFRNWSSPKEVLLDKCKFKTRKWQCYLVP